MNTTKTTKNIVLSALFLALAYELPFVTGQIQQIGIALCPMHIPVLLCGFVCGWQWGLVVGIVAPLLRSFSLGMPPMFPVAVSMAFELAAYGAVSGIMYSRLSKKGVSVYISLITAMIAGRIVWGSARFALAGFDAQKFGLTVFWAGAVTGALPGIILHILIIPPIIMSIEKFNKNKN